MNRYAIICLVTGVLSFTTLIGTIACNDDKIVTQKDLKNRVPDVQTAQKAAQDAQSAAAQAQETLKQIQEARKTPEPPTVIYTQDGTPQEQTHVGRVTDVTEIWEEQSSSYYGEAYEAFTFVEDGGFQKRFYPVCSDQMIQTGKSEIVLYHWKPNKNTTKHNQKGCFAIDGYLQK
jgi:hypothetical protein